MHASNPNPGTIDQLLRMFRGARLEVERGIMVAFEGPRGAGKTSVVRLTAALLAAAGVRTMVLKHPSHSALAAEAMGLTRTGLPVAAAAAYIADMAASIYTPGGDITDELAGGLVVLIDRYYYSTMVYQGILESEGHLDAVAELAGILPPPHVVVYVDPGCRRVAENRALRDAYSLDPETRRVYEEECVEEARAYRRILGDESLLVPGQAWRRLVKRPEMFGTPTVIHARHETVELNALHVATTLIAVLEERGLARRTSS